MSELISMQKGDRYVIVRDDWEKKWSALGWKKVEGILSYGDKEDDLVPSHQDHDDGLDDLDAAALHELAKERGVEVHHKAGADKVREALRVSEKE